MSDAAKLRISTPSDREVVMTRAFEAPQPLVFEALTSPALLRRWLVGPEGWTMTVCEVDLRPGGAIRFAWRGPDGAEMGLSGVYREVEPPQRTVHTERFDEDWTGGEMQVTTVLEQSGDITTVTTTMLYGSQEARDGALGSGMKDGVAVSYDRLDGLLR